MLMINSGYVQLVRDLLGEYRRPVRPVCVVGGVEIHLKDVVDRRLARMEQKRVRGDSFEPLRMWVLQKTYELVPAKSAEGKVIRIHTSRSASIQRKEGFEELVNDKVFLRQLKQFAQNRQPQQKELDFMQAGLESRLLAPKKVGWSREEGWRKARRIQGDDRKKRV